MTTKELIDEYVSAHAENRWMDASELEALLTEFAEKLKEPASEDLEQAAQEYVTKEGYLAGLHYNSMVRSFKAGAEYYASHNTKLPDNLLLAARKASIDLCSNINDKYLDEYPYNPIAEQKFIEGAQWQREQMMKDAIEGRVVAVRNVMSDRLHTYPWIELEAQLSKNDKVKVIIIKE